METFVATEGTKFLRHGNSVHPFRLWYFLYGRTMSLIEFGSSSKNDKSQVFVIASQFFVRRTARLTDNTLSIPFVFFHRSRNHLSTTHCLVERQKSNKKNADHEGFAKVFSHIRKDFICV